MREISKLIAGILEKDSESQNNMLKKIEDIVSKDSSDLSQKIAKFLKVTWRRSGGDRAKIEQEQARLVKLLDENSENISSEKVTEFRVRLQVLKVLQ